MKRKIILVLVVSIIMASTISFADSNVMSIIPDATIERYEEYVKYTAADREEFLHQSLDSVMEQLKEQDAEDMYPLFEEIITDKIKKSMPLQSDERATSSEIRYMSDGSGGIIKYHSAYGDVDIVDTYYGLGETWDFYYSLIRPKDGWDSLILEIVSEIAGYFGISFSGMENHYNKTILIPLRDIAEKKKRANVFTAVDNFDMGRMTSVVIEWRSYPYMSRPSNATNVRYRTYL